MATLIIAEKPSVALRLATALAEGTPEKKRGHGRASYYEFKRKGKEYYVATAVGHIFTIRQASKGRGYPVLEVEWAPSYSVNKTSEFTKDYYETIKMVAEKCDHFVNACDYDTEGTVIGTNVLKFIGKNALAHAKRMKFSTTTSRDLQNSYNNLLELDMNNFYAGEARHMLDWLWGINLSRALTSAVRGSSSSAHSLSIGRVQGPALAMMAKKEIEISKFVPKPFWKISLFVEEIEFSNTRGEIFDKKDAENALADTQENLHSAKIESVDATSETMRPLPPFDLTSLQVEASRILRIDPSETLRIAQTLYERAFISYPRTSSQKLPATLGLPAIISELAKNPTYRELSNRLVKEERFTPLEGVKADEAHPAIFPTGVTPVDIGDRELKLYDMITRRFLSCFAEVAEIARTKVIAKIGKETYAALAKRIVKKGWLEYYIYAKVEESTLKAFKIGDSIKPTGLDMKESQTQPPRRYSKAGAIVELEKRGLGTKATRAAIIDTLFRRKYIDGNSIQVTDFGMSVFESLEKNCKMIVDEQTTRQLEDDMELIVKGTKKEEEVIDEGKTMLLQALKSFDEHKTEVAESMRSSLNQMNVLGKCPADGGELVVRWSRAGKRFAGCNNYPKCTRTYSLPQKGKIVPTGKICEGCKTPIILVSFGRGRELEIDLDPACPLRAKTTADQIQPTVVKPSPFKSKVEIAVGQPETTTKVVEQPKVAAEEKKVKKRKSASKTVKQKKPKGKKKVDVLG